MGERRRGRGGGGEEEWERRGGRGGERGGGEEEEGARGTTLMVCSMDRGRGEDSDRTSGVAAIYAYGMK